MKVHILKKDTQTTIPHIIATIVFLIVPTIIFIYLKDDFGVKIKNIGIGLILAICFFLFGIYLLTLLIKKPKKYTAKLISKKELIHNNQNIIYMTFKVYKNNTNDFIPKTFKCYTYENNNLEINNNYPIYLKEFNWRIKKIDLKEETNITYTKKTNMIPVFIFIEIILIFNIVFAILGIIFYKEYSFFYSLWIILFSLLIPYSIIFFIKYNQDNTKDNTKDKTTSLKELNYKPLLPNQKVGNIILINITKVFIIIQTIWLIIYLSLSNKISLIILLTPSIILIMFSIIFKNYDKKLIKKNNLIISNSASIENIKNFQIIRATKSITFEKYFITDTFNNLILIATKSDLLGNNYKVYTPNNKLIATISRTISFNYKYTVKIINKKPFNMRLKLQMQNNYEIIGLDNYKIEGNISGTENLITLNNEQIASIIAKTKNNLYELGNTNISLYNYKNNLEIVLMSLTITITNFHLHRRKYNK